MSVCILDFWLLHFQTYAMSADGFIIIEGILWFLFVVTVNKVSFSLQGEQISASASANKI